MLNKKKEDRPIITDLVEYFQERKVPYFKTMLMSELDQNNYLSCKKLSSYNKDFGELKKRVQQGN